MIGMDDLNLSQGGISLSPDTLDALCNMLGTEVSEVTPVTNVQDWPNIIYPTQTPTAECLGNMSEFISKHQNPPNMNTAGGSLPVVSNWPGDYSFKVFFDPQDEITKKEPWTLSESGNKLYTKIDSPCRINFSTNAPMPNGVFIRAMAVFSQPKDANEVVYRCVNHSMADITKQLPEAEHLIQCGSSQSVYAVDFYTQRLNVCVPFENPPVGQEFSTYLYKFTCYTSCAGGANRRPTTIVFTLEDGNNVLGRQSFELKVCACPSRDKKNDETPKEPVASSSRALEHQSESIKNNPKKLKLSSDNIQAEMIMDITAGAPQSKTKKQFIVKATDEKMFSFLIEMKKFYEMEQSVNNFMAVNSDSLIRSMLFMVRSSSSEDDEENT